MKRIGIMAMVAGIVVFVLGLVGVVGQGDSFRIVMIGVVILLAAGFLLYRRGPRRLIRRAP